MKPRHWALSRKWLSYLFTSGTLVVAALIVRNGNYAALATALVAAMSAFTVGNTVAGAVGEKAAAPKKTEDAPC